MIRPVWVYRAPLATHPLPPQLAPALPACTQRDSPGHPVWVVSSARINPKVIAQNIYSPVWSRPAVRIAQSITALPLVALPELTPRACYSWTPGSKSRNGPQRFSTRQSISLLRGLRLNSAALTGCSIDIPNEKGLRKFAPPGAFCFACLTANSHSFHWNLVTDSTPLDGQCFDWGNVRAR